MSEVLTYEALKADRDAQQKRADALAVERDAALNAVASIYKTVTGERPEWSNWHAYLDDIIEEVGAALAAIEARGVEKFVDMCREKSKTTTYPDDSGNWKTCAAHASAFAFKLREAK